MNLMKLMIIFGLCLLVLSSSLINIKSYAENDENSANFLLAIERINVLLKLIEENNDYNHALSVAKLANDIDLTLRSKDDKLADDLYLKLVDLPALVRSGKDLSSHIVDTRVLLDKALVTVIPERNKTLYAQVIFSLITLAEKEYENGNYDLSIEYMNRAYNIYKENINNDELNDEFEKAINLMIARTDVSEVSSVNSKLQRDFISIFSGSNINHKQYFDEIRRLYDELLKEYKNGNYLQADEYAIEAYLDNYEFLEPPLANVDKELMEELEVDMRIELREMIKDKVNYDEIKAFIDEILAKLEEAEKLLDEHIITFEADIINVNGNGNSNREIKLGSASDEAKKDVMSQVDAIRLKLMEVLEAYRNNDYDLAYEKARSAYLDNYEFIEIPLAPIDPNFTLEAEIKFSELRQLINGRASYEEVQSKIVEIRKILDESERLVTGTGIIAPTIAFSSSYAIIFREGLESALIVGAIITYLEATRNDKYKKHIYYGVLIALGATAITWFLAAYVIEISGVGRETIEAIAALSATAILFYVSFWILNKVEAKKWIEFVKAKVWQATTTGSAMVLVSLAFFTVYREGFETVLFYQAMFSFAKYMENYVLLGFILGISSLLAVYYFMRKLGKRLPLKMLFGLTMGIGAYLSLAFIGNGIRELQEAGYMQVTPLFGIIPRLDINLATMTGIHPTLETIIAQMALLSVYIVGMSYTLIIKPRRERAILLARRSRKEIEG
ncbi:MAG: hypothetical protein KatS3mg003_0271 [Candidatus Nitrosocaldaceae archaeon]|nr:MAG: hypothetical protein KatS3mg003_0271 [Candidatus Nitrosocaldaceae archaeon]